QVASPKNGDCDRRRRVAFAHGRSRSSQVNRVLARARGRSFPLRFQTSANSAGLTMDLTNSQRFAKLAGHLLQHPGNVPRYLTHNLITRREPVELELPWFSYAAIDFLKSYLRSEMQVFAFGSGGSTLFFAQHCKSVASVEDNAHWCEIGAARLARRGIENVNLRYVPAAYTGEEEFLG